MIVWRIEHYPEARIMSLFVLYDEAEVEVVFTYDMALSVSEALATIVNHPETMGARGVEE